MRRVNSKLKSEKKVVNLQVIKQLAELFPQMTIIDLLEYLEYCEMIKNEMEIDIVGVTDIE